MKKISTAFILLFLFACILSKAQEPIYNNYKWLKVEDGLPQSFISGIQQDKDGFIWIGSRDGLARYDGREFKIFRNDIKDSTSIRSNVIRSIYLDSENLLWVFYVNNQFDCFNPELLKIVKPANNTVQDLMTKYDISSFIRDRSGNFWLNTNYKGIISVSSRQDKIRIFDTSHHNLRSNFNLGITEGANGEIFIITDKGIQQLKGNFFTPGELITFPGELNFSLKKGYYYKTASLLNGNLVISDHNRLIVFNPQSKNFTSLPILINHRNKDKPVNHLFAKGSDLYFEQNGDVYKLNQDFSFSFIWATPSQKENEKPAISLLVDRSGVIWFGSNGEGLYKIDANSLAFYPHSYNQNFHTGILESLLQEKSSKLPLEIKSPLWSYGFRFCYSPDKTLYFSAGEFLDKSPVNERVYFIKDGILFQMPAARNGFSKAIRGLAFSGEILYAIDIDGNIYEWNNLKLPPQCYKSVLNLHTNTAITDLVADKNTFWIATDKEGLFKLENYTKVTHYTKGVLPNHLPGNQLTGILQDKKHSAQLWIGTLGNGLIKWDKDKGVIKTLQVENGLPNNTIYSMLQDEQNNLWASTNNGLSRIQVNESGIETYSVKDGLPGNEFNRFHHFLFADGRMAFGGLEGYVIFDPGQYIKDSFKTSVALTKLFINNTEDTSGVAVNTIKTLSLPYDKNFLQFEFAGLQMNHPEKIQYRYKLEGYDKDWISAGNRNLATYTRLPHGRYTLKVNATNTAGIWSTIIKTIDIKIHPPFWLTWWAYCIYGIIFTVVALAIRNYRESKRKLKNEIYLEHKKAEQLAEVDGIKSRFFDNITHEFRTPLTLILTPLQKLKNEPGIQESHRNILFKAYQNAEKLLKLINQLLDISRLEAGQMKIHYAGGDISEFVYRCANQFTELANQKNIQFHVQTGAPGNYLFDAEKWEKIIYNLLSNAIKFTPQNGKIQLTFENIHQQNKTIASLMVKNTGNVISQEHIIHIFDRFYMMDDSGTKANEGTGIGLELVKELTEIMNGEVMVTSNPLEGTVFTVNIPVIPSEKTDEFISISPSTIIDKKDIARDALNDSNCPLVLIAEDNDELRQFLVESLSPRFRLIQAGNGKAALNIILNELPEIVISDIMMPEMDGNELCNIIKKDSRTAHISFIMLTAKASHDSKLSGLEAGADVYMSKPFHLDELELQVNNLLKQQENIRKHLQQQVFGKRPPVALPQVSNEFLTLLYEVLDNHIDDAELNVESLARHLAMSRRTLSRKLDNLLHISPNELIRNYRLQKAAVLISSGNTISQAAYTVGFESPSYFSQCFKELYGITPSEFASLKTA